MLKLENKEGIIPALLAAGFTALNLRLAGGAVKADTDPSLHAAGSFLLAGLPGGDVNFNMPLFSTVFAAARDLGASPVLFFIAIHLANYALAFIAGRLIRGYAAGLLGMIAAGIFSAFGGFHYNAEQSFYTFFLLLALNLLILWRRQDTMRNALLAGLAIGASLLVRTPLFLFPPLALLAGRLSGKERAKGRTIREVAFLAAACAPLLPWGALNQFLSGKFTLLDDRRSACNLITAAKGSVFTMNGNPFRLAGISEKDSALAYFARETAKDPLFHAITAAKRLWHIFLFHPLLTLLFLLVLLKNRCRDGAAFGLGAYFILIHAPLSIEERYFYPLAFLLPPPIAAGMLRSGPEEDPRGTPAERLILAAFALSFCAVLAVEALVLAYPYRSARPAPDAVERAAARFPKDKTLRGLRCREFWTTGEDEEYFACLRESGREFGDKIASYLSAAASAKKVSELETLPGCRLDCLVIRMLRELELGDGKAAEASYKKAFAAYQSEHNMLRGTPYARDKELDRLLKEDSSTFWQACVYPKLLMRPPENMALTLKGLGRLAPAGGRLALARDALRDTGTRGEFGDRPLRNWLAPAVLGLPMSELRKLWRRGAEQSAGLSAAAEEKVRAGDYKSAEALYAEAAGLARNPDTAGALLSLCKLRVKSGKEDRALNACQNAAYAAYFGAEGTPPAVGAEASFETYKLLKSMGRKAEAEAVLRRTIDNAPLSWHGLAGAKTELKSITR